MAGGKLVRRALSGVIAFEIVACASVAAGAEWDKPGWELTFQDEFDGSSLDLAKWKKRYKWGEAIINNELEAYVDDAFVVQNGTLSIIGTHAPGQYAGTTLEYRSGVICSLYEQTYGYFESRLKVPKGQGYWPAFWLLGAVGTANVNEIDIHEILGNDTTTAYMTVHWGTSYDVGHEADGNSFTGPDFATDFHVFGLEWDPDAIHWTIDGVERNSHTGVGVPQVPMYMILNLAIGGSWPGAPDATTPFPGVYEIDYVRAYKRSSADAGSAGSAGASAGAGGSSGAPSGGGTSSGGASGKAGSPSGGASAKPEPEESSGCGCRTAQTRAHSLELLGALLALALGWARRSRCARRDHSAH